MANKNNKVENHEAINMIDKMKKIAEKKEQEVEALKGEVEKKPKKNLGKKIIHAIPNAAKNLIRKGGKAMVKCGNVMVEHPEKILLGGIGLIAVAGGAVYFKSYLGNQEDVDILIPESDENPIDDSDIVIEESFEEEINE